MSSTTSGPDGTGDVGAVGADGGPSGALRGEPGFRTPPDDFVAAASVAPNHWLSVIDRHWRGSDDEAPPSWAVLGRWRSDEHGEIVEWERNSEYRPSPDALGWARPVGPADAAVQLAATGYGTEESLVAAVAEAELAVCVGDDGRPAVTEAPDGTPVVPVFSTSPGLEKDRLPAHRVMPVPELLARLPRGCDVLFLSSSAPVARILAASALRSRRG
ncbi:type VII secretion system-associated protein [Streptomyces sp. NPDC048278]|uniref:type VII secretion system-associated protein n=1 Tax=Streptomyces sp. NPDC048278 TaxID=3155809 RepID=UPI003418455A